MILTVLITISSLVITVYFYFRWKHTFWSSRSVPQVRPTIPYGNIKGIGRDSSPAIILQKCYQQLKGHGPFGGIYFFTNPIALAVDLDFIKSILIKDFGVFQDRGVFTNKQADPLSEHLFSLTGQKWKILRQKLTPTFTSGKMKFMFSTIVSIGERFANTIEHMVECEPVIELRELLAKFMTDVIGECAFGIECNSLENPDAEFRQMGKKVVEVPRHGIIMIFLIASFKPVARFFGIKRHHDDVIDFFTRIVRETVSFRKNNNVERRDFMDILMKLKLQGDENALTFEEIASQAFLFFMAGYETSSATVGFALHEMAVNQDIQDKVRSEINDVMKRHNGTLTYEGMLELTYLDKVISETLRKYPPAFNLMRATGRDYEVDGLTLPKGIVVHIPTYAIHHDPEFYPKPEVFDPERFSDENKNKRHPMAYLPFGEGPRNCIGIRFAMMQAKIGIIFILKNFKLTPSEKTVHPIKLSPKGFILKPDGGRHWLHFERISNVMWEV